MKQAKLLLDYISIEELLNLIDDPEKSICHQILNDNRALFEQAQGSTHNHQTWEGGYIDHVTDCMNIARHLYDFFSSFGRTLPFTLSDVLLVLFIHDLEKPWRILVNQLGQASNREGIATKEEFKRFREEKLFEYRLLLNPKQANAFLFIEGEGKSYSSDHRVMNELAVFCHMVDYWSARGWYDYPKPEGKDEWSGAGRFRTV